MGDNRSPTHSASLADLVDTEENRIKSKPAGKKDKKKKKKKKKGEAAVATTTTN